MVQNMQMIHAICGTDYDLSSKISVRARNYKNGVLSGHGTQLCNNIEEKHKKNSLPSENVRVYTHDFLVNMIPENVGFMNGHNGIVIF